MDTVLVVDDDKMIRHVVRVHLEDENIMVIEAATVKRLFDILGAYRVDLILLDLGLPDGDGMDCIAGIRAQTDAPLLIVSGDGEDAKKLQGFHLGADDYIAKPFNAEELVARVKSSLRRYKGVAGTATPQQKSQGAAGDDVVFGSWRLRRSHHQVYGCGDVSLKLTAQEFRILDGLLQRAGQVIRRDELCEIVRDEYNYAPSPRAIDIKVMRIRKKLDGGAGGTMEDIIKTMRGVGYMFNPDCLDQE